MQGGIGVRAVALKALRLSAVPHSKRRAPFEAPSLDLLCMLKYAAKSPERFLLGGRIWRRMTLLEVPGTP